MYARPMLEINQFECSPGPHRASGWWGRLIHKWAFMTQTECIYERGNAPAWRAVVGKGFLEEVVAQLKSEGGKSISYLGRRIF